MQRFLQNERWSIFYVAHSDLAWAPTFVIWWLADPFVLHNRPKIYLSYVRSRVNTTCPAFGLRERDKLDIVCHSDYNSRYNCPRLAVYEEIYPTTVTAILLLEGCHYQSIRSEIKDNEKTLRDKLHLNSQATQVGRCIDLGNTGR